MRLGKNYARSFGGDTFMRNEMIEKFFEKFPSLRGMSELRAVRAPNGGIELRVPDYVKPRLVPAGTILFSWETIQKFCVDKTKGEKK